MTGDDRTLSEQHVVVYGPEENPRACATAYTHHELVLACGYARRAHRGEDVRAVPASLLPSITT